MYKFFPIPDIEMLRSAIWLFWKHGAHFFLASSTIENLQEVRPVAFSGQTGLVFWALTSVNRREKYCFLKENVCNFVLWFLLQSYMYAPFEDQRFIILFIVHICIRKGNCFSKELTAYAYNKRYQRGASGKDLWILNTRVPVNIKYMKC